MADTSRAGQIVEQGRVDCVETPIEYPGAGQLLVHSAYASICGSDLHVVNDGVETDPRMWKPGYPGHEGIGRVIDSHAEGFAVGDTVLCVPNVPEARCFSEFQRIRATSTVKLEGDLPPLDQCLMAKQLGTVIFAHRQHPHDVAGRTVVVMGQGSAGLFWAWLLKRAGAAMVIVADKSPTRLAASPGFGADVALDVNETDVTAAVLDLTGGVGADYVVEAVGHADSFLQSVSLVRTDGAIFWFGLPDTNRPIQMDFRLFFRKRLTAYSSYGAQNEEDLRSFRVAVEHIRRGDIDVTPLLSHILPIESVGRAFELADSRDDGAMKVSVSF